MTGNKGSTILDLARNGAGGSKIGWVVTCKKVVPVAAAVFFLFDLGTARSFGAEAGWKDWANGGRTWSKIAANIQIVTDGRKFMRALTFVHPWGNFSCGTRVPSRAL